MEWSALNEGNKKITKCRELKTKTKLTEGRSAFYYYHASEPLNHVIDKIALSRKYFVSLSFKQSCGYTVNFNNIYISFQLACFHHLKIGLYVEVNLESASNTT